MGNNQGSSSGGAPVASPAPHLAAAAAIAREQQQVQQQQQPSPQGSLEEFMGAQQYIDEIRRLENELKAKQEHTSQLQQAIRHAQHQHSQLTLQMTEDHNRRRAEHLAELEARNERELRALTDNKKRELDGLILQVDDILQERRQMTREDVTAEVRRELAEAWAQSATLLKARLEKQREVELGVSRSTHDRMKREFVAKLHHEEAALRAVAAQRQEQRSSGKKRGSGGIFSWLSPNKLAREDEDDDDDDE